MGAMGSQRFSVRCSGALRVKVDKGYTLLSARWVPTLLANQCWPASL